MSSKGDKLYVYFNNLKVVDQTIIQFFNDQGGGRTFSEFAKSIIFHHAQASGYEAQISKTTAPPLPIKVKTKPKRNNDKDGEKRVVPEKETDLIGDGAGEMEEGEGESLIPPQDSISDDILSAVNSIM